MHKKSLLTGGPASPESPFLPFLPLLPGGPGGPTCTEEKKKEKKNIQIITLSFFCAQPSLSLSLFTATMNL